MKAKALEDQQKQDPINEKEENNISNASSNKNTLREQQVIFSCGNWFNFKLKKKKKKKKKICQLACETDRHRATCQPISAHWLFTPYMW